MGKVEEANSLLKGIVFDEKAVYENGVFERAGVTQSLVLKPRTNMTKYPYRKYYDVKIRRRNSSLPSRYYTDYNFYVYVDEGEKITELTPLIIYSGDGWHEQKQTPTKEDYADIVYRLFFGVDAWSYL